MKFAEFCHLPETVPDFWPRFHFIRPKSFKWQQWLIAVFFVLIAAFLLLRSFFGPVIYTNDTESAPRGIYVVAPDQYLTYGDYVIVHSPVDIPDIHIPKDFPLLKRVAAFPGDTYTVTDSTFKANGEIYTIHHLPWLPQLPHGTFAVPEGTMLFLNPPEDSLDSRYFGPIPMANVERKVLLLVNYDAIDRFLYQFF